MKNKKVLIISLVIVIIVAIGFGVFKIYDSYLFKSDGKMDDGHKELIEHLQELEDADERKKQIDFSIEQNLINQEEANELY